ncbi:MAG: prolyl oligopeptidase family serine peptidase, partial [Clostridium sp.]
MKVTAYVSEEIARHIKNNEDYTVIENQGIIPLLNDISLMDEICNDKYAFKYLKDIEIDGDYFVFDIIEEFKDLVKFQTNYITKDNYYKQMRSKSILNMRRYLLKRNEISSIVFKEAYRVFINKILRQIETRKVFFLNVKLIENCKENSLVESELLEVYVAIIKELSPGINIIDLELNINTESLNKKSNDLIKEMIELEKANKKITGERIFPSIYPIKYYFEKASLFNKDKLIISFSAFSTDKPKYNYKSTLKFVDCNKLFILDDYGEKGSYYLGLNGDLNIESSVISLITHIVAANNISFNNITSIGSSKGGTAAIYYALKYSFGNAIAGAPQYKVGSYLSDLSIKRYAKEIFGDINLENRVKYDNLIRISSVNNNKTRVKILTSDGDRQYKTVLKDLENLANEYDLNIKIDKCSIESHAEIANVFPSYLVENLKGILGSGCINNNLSYKVKQKIQNLRIKKGKGD